MGMNNLRRGATGYVTAFSKRDLAALAELFDDNVSLRDWNMEALGKHAVLEAARGIFSTASSLEIGISNMVVDCEARTVVAELDISIDGGKPQKVVDMLVFTSEGLLSAIRAYKG